MMTVDILGLHLSPRRRGNSGILLEEFLKGAAAGGAVAQTFSVSELKITGCLECGGCEKDGCCVIHDDMDQIYPYLAETPLVVISTPLFFYDVPAQGKALIDRTQALWNRRYRLSQRRNVRPGARGFLLAVGATKGQDLFLPATLCLKYFFDALGLPKEFDSLCFRRIEAAGDIAKDPEHLRQAFEAGLALAQSKGSRPASGSAEVVNWPKEK